jgi:hypothetical protein
LQILVSASQANRATAGDRSQPQAQFKSQSKNFFVSRTDNLLAGKQSPFLGEAVAIVLSSPAGLWKLFRDQAERGSGIGLKLFGFIRNRCSPSPRNPVRVHPGTAFGIHPGMAFGFDRIPHRAPRYSTRQILPFWLSLM